ncbi:POK9 protein, partial [Asarcornis scutulata]|nr:POK9 protein [Asarcornis scutulata]
RGSLGVDLATAVSVTLSDKSVAAIPTGIQGPLSNTPLGGLLLGRSSVGLKGLMVIPGVIDADHIGEIRVMAYTLNPPLFIPKGTRIAQLVALQNYQPCAGAQVDRAVDRAGGFGSTDHVICFTRSLASRPMMNVILSIGSHQITVTDMIDSGADVMICS